MEFFTTQANHLRNPQPARLPATSNSSASRSQISAAERRRARDDDAESSRSSTGAGSQPKLTAKAAVQARLNNEKGSPKADRKPKGEKKRPVKHTPPPDSPKDLPAVALPSIFPMQAPKSYYLDPQRSINARRAQQGDLPSSQASNSSARNILSPRGSKKMVHKHRREAEEKQKGNNFDSPDPLQLTPTSSVPGTTPSPTVGKIVGRKAPQSPTERRKSQLSGPRTYGRNNVTSPSSISSVTSDEEATPRPLARRRIQGSQRKVAKVIESDDEDVSGGMAFFRQVKDMNAKDKHKFYGRKGESSVEHISHDEDTSEAPLEIDVEEEDAFTPEEKAYLEGFVDPERTCPYCSGAWPRRPSQQLQALAENLELATSALDPGGQLSWQQTVDHCSAHEAETTTVPLGIRQGYPVTRDFSKVPGKLEQDWVRCELDRIMSQPESSAFFNRVIKDINKKGKNKWDGLAHQAARRTLDLSTPGYYGDIGKAVIFRHFSDLLTWGLAPQLSDLDTIAPLTAIDFIRHVLVPEASIRLIMMDKGWTGGYGDISQEWTAARTLAFSIRKESVEYGRSKFMEGSALAQEAQDILQATEKARRAACEQRRRVIIDVPDSPIAIPNVKASPSESGTLITTPSSDPDTPRPKDRVEPKKRKLGKTISTESYGDSDMDWGAADEEMKGKGY